MVSAVSCGVSGMAGATLAQKKAIVLISGGIDSTVALWWAMKKDWEIVPLTMSYNERPKAERKALRAILRKTRISGLIEVPLDFIKEAQDLVKDGLGGDEFPDSPEGYIPARNMIFYSIAAYYAESIGADVIIGGHNEGDPDEFPDSSKRFFESMERLYGIGLWSGKGRKVRILLPLAGKDKVGVVRLGLRLGVPLSATWSCSSDGAKPCGRCGSCIERDEAFAELGIDGQD